MLGTQITSKFKALVLSISTYGTENWGDDLESSHWKVIEEDMKLYMMFHSQVRSSTT